MRFPVSAIVCSSLLIPFLLPSCGTKANLASGGTHPRGTGPFDSSGNYVEAWADNPSKWGKSRSSPATPDLDPPLIARNEQPPANSIPLQTTPMLVNNTPSRNSARTTASTPKPSTKQVASNTKPKPKASSSGKSKAKAPTRYVIKKGDSLYKIAAKYKTTVTALQRANGIKGSLIHPGKTLVIPRY